LSLPHHFNDTYNRHCILLHLFQILELVSLIQGPCNPHSELNAATYLQFLFVASPSETLPARDPMGKQLTSRLFCLQMKHLALVSVFG
jgi:hypothetical protein